MGSAVIFPRGVVAPGDPAPVGVTLDAACAEVRATFARHAWPAGEITLQIRDEAGVLCSATVAGGERLLMDGVTVAPADDLVFRAVTPAGEPAILSGSVISAHIIAPGAIDTEIQISWG